MLPNFDNDDGWFFHKIKLISHFLDRLPDPLQNSFQIRMFAIHSLVDFFVDLDTSFHLLFHQL